MRVLFFGSYDVRVHPRVGVLAEGLRDLGEDVIEVNAPLNLSTRWRVRLVQHPWLLPVLAVRLLWSWIRLIARSVRLQQPDVVVIGYLGHFDIHLARLLWPGVPRVLDFLVAGNATARDRRVGGAVRHRVLAAIDAAALRASDLVIVDTEQHQDALPASHRAQSVTVPVGASGHWFRQPQPRGAQAPLRVVFFGLYTPLQGAQVVGAAIKRLGESHPGIQFTMIGHGQDYDATRELASSNPTVGWVDWVEAHELPGLVWGHDVCLGIFGTSDKAHRVVPNKVYQGAAAGCAIITSDTGPQREALGEGGVFVPPGDPEALAEAIGRLADDRDSLWRARSVAYARARDRFTPGMISTHLRDRIASIAPMHEAEGARQRGQHT